MKENKKETNKKENKKETNKIVILESIEPLRDHLHVNDFEIIDYFDYIGNIEVRNEKWEFKPNEIVKSGHAPAVYLIVVDGFILKIGLTEASIKERIGSYNAGKIKHRGSGTCSTTNYHVTQTILNLYKAGSKIEMYGYFPPIEKMIVHCFGTDIEGYIKQTSYIEKEAIRRYEQQCGRKPIL